MNLNLKKRKILRLIRTKQFSTQEAAGAVGESRGQVALWAIRDKDFGRALKALMLVKQIDFILHWDAELRSGRPLDVAEENCVHVARRLARMLAKEF